MARSPLPHRSARRMAPYVAMVGRITPATTRVIANCNGSRVNARTNVVILSIGAPTTNDRVKFVEAPCHAKDGTITAAHQEQNGCGIAYNAPVSVPIIPVRENSDFM